MKPLITAAVILTSALAFTYRAEAKKISPSITNLKYDLANNRLSFRLVLTNNSYRPFYFSRAQATVRYATTTVATALINTPVYLAPKSVTVLTPDINMNPFQILAEIITGLANGTYNNTLDFTATINVGPLKINFSESQNLNAIT